MNPIGLISTGASRVTSLVVQNPLITALVMSAASSFFSYGVGIAIATISVGHATSSYFELANDLTSWCAQATNEEKPSRIEAAKRIKSCYVRNSYDLNLGGLKLTNLPDSIGNLTSLQKLDLSDNQLTTIPDSIGNLISLKKLNLSGNELSEIPDSIRYLRSLENLNLSLNQLSEMPDSIENLNSLKHLNLICNKLTKIPKSIGNLNSLEWLLLSRNQLTTIPDSIGNLSSLIKLDLQRNQLTTIPDSIGKLRALLKLDLQINQLTTIPDCIENLSSLTSLNLDSNKLTTIPVSIGNLSSLISLNLNSNHLTTIPDSIGKLSSLQELDLHNNQLSTIPDSIGNLNLLSKLDLHSNQLIIIPNSIGNLISLISLNLENNQLTAIPDSIGNHNFLSKLDLHSNQLTTIPDSIGNLNSLISLSLHSNRLTAIPLTLANLSHRCQLCALNNRLSLVAIQTFQDAIAQTRQLHPLLGPNFEFTIYDTPSLQVESLEENLHFWLKKFQIIFPKNSNTDLWINRDTSRYPIEGFPIESLSFFYNPLLELDDQEKMNLAQFLQRVQKTQDFKSPRTQGNVVLRVDRMLEGACKNPEFLRMMNWIIEGALSTCNDRVAEALDQIEIQWKILCNSQNLTDQKLADLVIGLDRLDRLNLIANAKIEEKQLGDAIEVILFYRTKLAKALNLPISTESMLYPSMAGITTEELEEARKKIIADTGSRNSKIEILCNSTLWSDRIREKESEFFEKLIDDLNESSELNPDVLQIETNAQIKEAIRRFTRSILYSN